MSKYIIEGGHRLNGDIRPQGAKNEALQVISAVLLTKEPVTIHNVPNILDVKNLIDLLKAMNVKVDKSVKAVIASKLTTLTKTIYQVPIL